MNKPSTLIELIQELQSEDQPSDVGVYKGSKAVVYTTAKALNAEDGIVLNANECQMLFASTETIERLVEALDSDSASLVITNIDLPDASLEALERSFVTVDEE